MTLYKFPEVAITAVGKNANGKRRQKKFYQTLNPYNRNNKGKQKTREEIHEELIKEAEEWKKEIAKSEE